MISHKQEIYNVSLKQDQKGNDDETEANCDKSGSIYGNGLYFRRSGKNLPKLLNFAEGLVWDDINSQTK